MVSFEYGTYAMVSVLVVLVGKYLFDDEHAPQSREEGDGMWLLCQCWVVHVIPRWGGGARGGRRGRGV